MAEIVSPYFVSTEVPDIDFNREIVPPETNKTFPDGAIGIRTDGDFWAVAALPYKYLDVPLAEIVKALWPQYADEAELCPDSGTPEQEAYFAR
jgi:hypothetical protein